MAYAEGTSVPVSRSREELHYMLERVGCDEVGYAAGTNGRARVAFKVKGLMFAMLVEIPDESTFTRTSKDPRRARIRTPEQRRDAWLAEERRRWRAMVLIVKAKLEAIASGVSTFEGEFMANVVMANGRLLGEEMVPRLGELVKSGCVPSLMLGPGGAS